MEVLPVREEDLPEIFSLEQRIEGGAGAGIDVLQARRQAFPDGFLAAWETGCLVGYLESCLWNRENPQFDPHPDFFAAQHRADGKILYIIFIGVAPDYRRLGTASTLIKSIIPVARKYGAERIQAVTRPHLLRLYTKLGFVALREIPFFLPGLVDEFRLMELAVQD